MSIPAYNPKELHFLFPQYCPCPNCDYYKDPDNYITKDGTYPVRGEIRRRQRLRCNLGGHRFSETRYSALFGGHGSLLEYEQTAKMTAYGMSAAQIADVLLRDERTVLGWQQALGKKCKTFHLSVCSLIGMVLTFLQMDEMWSY
jgi:transposase-like protein